MNTYLEGRVRNTSLPLTQGLLPLFEAVVNSIQATEELSPDEGANGKIVITICRESQHPEFEQMHQGRSSIPIIESFTIEDAGCGFNKANFDAFMTLDTPHKANKGCKGMGRLMWLKAFKDIRISSTYFEEGKWWHRSFLFSLPEGVTNHELKPLEVRVNDSKTIVKLEGFKRDYQQKSHKLAKVIAQDILNHCMWYFLRAGQLPDIVVKDSTEEFSLIDLYESSIENHAKSENIEIKGYSFSLLHIKFRSEIKDNAILSYCANNRLVRDEKLSTYDNLFSCKLRDDEGSYSYQCFLTSDILDRCVLSDRSEFSFDIDSALLGGHSITKEDITNGVISAIKEYLAEDITRLREETTERVNTFVETKGPRYRGIIKNLRDGELTPSSSDKEIELKLHEKLHEVEASLLEEGQNILSYVGSADHNDIRSKIEDYYKKVETVKASDLASYVFQRKMVLKILEKAIQINQNDKYSKEETVHSLIFPMRASSDQFEIQNENLWIIDERLVFHHYLASDKTITSLPITSARDNKEPDIASMRLYDSALDGLIENPYLVSECPKNGRMASLTLVEFKRPMRNDSENPFEQVYTYLEKIRSGNVTTKDGRPIANSDKLPCYAYIIADLSPHMEKYCVREDLKKTYDGMGYFGYKANLDLYVAVVSYDQLLIAAQERNQAFFDKLGISSL